MTTTIFPDTVSGGLRPLIEATKGPVPPAPAALTDILLAGEGMTRLLADSWDRERASISRGVEGKKLRSIAAAFSRSSGEAVALLEDALSRPTCQEVEREVIRLAEEALKRGRKVHKEATGLLAWYGEGRPPASVLDFARQAPPPNPAECESGDAILTRLRAGADL